MNKKQIKDLALSNGFKLKEQPSGEMDLNPYVYEFASALIAKANERVKELEKELQPDMFWNSDGDMSFDSIEELFDYYGDCHEGGELLIDCRIGVSLPDKTYKGTYDADNNEWVITEQLRKEQGE